MSLTEEEIRLDELGRIMSGANEAAGIRTPASGSREINYYDFAYYIFNRRREINKQRKLSPEEWFEHER